MWRSHVFSIHFESEHRLTFGWIGREFWTCTAQASTARHSHLSTTSKSFPSSGTTCCRCWRRPAFGAGGRRGRIMGVFGGYLGDFPLSLPSCVTVAFFRVGAATVQERLGRHRPTRLNWVPFYLMSFFISTRGRTANSNAGGVTGSCHRNSATWLQLSSVSISDQSP